MPVSAPALRFAPVWIGGLAFVLVTGGFAAGLGMTLHQTGPAPVQTAPPESSPDNPAITVYIPFGETQALPVPDGRIVAADLTLVIEGQPAELLSMQADIDARMPALRAQVLAAAQAVAETLPAGANLRDRLPDRIRSMMNSAVGTETLPAPVREVLVTKFMKQ